MHFKITHFRFKGSYKTIKKNFFIEHWRNFGWMFYHLSSLPRGIWGLMSH